MTDTILEKSFLDVEFRIAPRREAGYPVELVLGGEQHFTGYLTSDIIPWVPGPIPEADGQRLLAALLADGDLRRGWNEARCSPQRRIRLTLSSGASELHSLPWELLWEDGNFLATVADMPFSRYVETRTHWGRPRTRRPLRVLVAISNPVNLVDEYSLPAIDLTAERALLEEALHGFPSIELRTLEPPVTLPRLEAALREEYAVLHIVAHGGKSSSLLLQGEDGKVKAVTGEELGTLFERLDESQRPGLVVLTACHSADAVPEGTFHGLAPRIIQAGIPAVVAMQGQVSMSVARTFTATFYKRLGLHGVVDLALNEARSALLTEERPVAAPTLLMRLRDGLLFCFPPRNDFYRQVDLPPHYVSRPEALAAARAALLEASGSLALTSAVTVRARVDALHGMGGIGKTVVARALCDDPDVKAAFPDGILWTTLGQTPDLIACLREWVERLGGTISENAPTVSQLKNCLAELLAERACLLIVDDVWYRNDATAFAVGGPHCRLLLTTRDAAVARELGAVLHSLDVMAPQESLELLETWAEGALAATDPVLKRQIVERLGRLPLALKLAGAQLRRKAPERWLADFNMHKLHADRVETLHDSLERTFALSLDELLPEDRRCYVALAIFKEDEPIPLAALQRLWKALAGLDEEASVDLLDDLSDRALVQRIETSAGPAAVLHDLLRDFITAELGETGRMEGHRLLLEGYRRTWGGAGWHTAPDDGYLYAHLVYHLDALADQDQRTAAELRALFADDAWLHVRVSHDGYLYDGYIADLMTAWQHARAEAERQIEAEQSPGALADCIHYALIRTSINSLAANYPPELIVRAVETGAWTPERALSVMDKLQDLDLRISLLVRLKDIGQVPALLQKQATQILLAVVKEINEEEVRARALVALAPQLSGGLAAEGLSMVREIKDEGQRAKVLIAIAPQLGGALVSEGLAMARDISCGRQCADVLVALAPKLKGRLLEEGLEATRAIADNEERIKALAWLALQLREVARGPVLMEGLTAIREIKDEWSRAEALAVLMPQLKGELAVEGLLVAQGIKDEGCRVGALATASSQLKEQERVLVLLEALAVVREIKSERRRAMALAALSPHLRGELVAEGLAVARGIEDEWERARALTALTSQLSGDLLIEVLTAAREIKGGHGRAEVLVELVPRLSETLRTNVLLETLFAIREINDKWNGRVNILVKLVPYLSGELLEEGLTAACEIKDEWGRAQVLVALAPKLKGYLLLKSVEAALKISDEWQRTEVLSALTPESSGDLLAATQEIGDEGGCVRALVALMPWLEEEDRTWILEYGMALMRRVKHEEARVEILEALAPQLRRKLLKEALAVACEISASGSGRARALSALAPQLSGELLKNGLVAARETKGEWERAQILIALAPQLSASLMEEGLSATLEIKDEGERARVLVALAPRLSGVLLSEGLAAARELGDEGVRARVLSALAPQLSGELLMVGMSAVWEIEDEKNRALVLIALAPRLNEKLLAEGIEIAGEIENKRVQARVLSALVPQLSGELLNEGLEMVWEIEDEKDRALILIALAPRLSGELLAEGIEIAEEIKDEDLHARVLKAIAPQLSEDFLKEELMTTWEAEDEKDHASVMDVDATIVRKEDSFALQQMVVAGLWKLQLQEREVILESLADQTAFNPQALDLDPSIVDSICRSITEVCGEWEWL